MKTNLLRSLLGASALLFVGCGDSSSTDGPANSDLTVVGNPDVGGNQVPDLTVPPDLSNAPLVYSPTLLFSDLITNTTIQGMPVSVRVLSPSVFDPDPSVTTMHDYDDRNPGLPLGCFADHYNLAGGKKPAPDIDMGQVTFAGWTPSMPLGSQVPLPPAIGCFFEAATHTYACGYNAQSASNLGLDPSKGAYLASTTVIPTNSSVHWTIAGAPVPDGGGVAGPAAASGTANFTDTLVVTTDLTKDVFTTNADATIKFNCPGGNCPLTDLVLVQVEASTAAPTDASYPGLDFGTLNCVGIVGMGSIVIPAKASTALFGGSASIKYVATRVIRGPQPLPAMDANGNKITIASGKGVLAIAPK